MSFLGFQTSVRNFIFLPLHGGNSNSVRHIIKTPFENSFPIDTHRYSNNFRVESKNVCRNCENPRWQLWESKSEYSWASKSRYTPQFSGFSSSAYGLLFLRWGKMRYKEAGNYQVANAQDEKRMKRRLKRINPQIWQFVLSYTSSNYILNI